MYEHARQIWEAAIREALPGEAVRRAIAGLALPSRGRLVLVSVGKAAWEMANAACACLRERVSAGIVITKYHHSKGALPPLEIWEAGHPIPDENGFRATERALALTSELQADDGVLFLLSGGGSALFEQPLLPAKELAAITSELLANGASIVEINTVRKRLSGVKGGRFALHCAPAQVHAVVLSDVIGDRLDMIASGPACADTSTCEEAVAIARRYALPLTKRLEELLHMETPKALSNVHAVVSGSMKQLCQSAANTCQKLGYTPFVLTTSLTCEAREAGAFLAAVAREHQSDGRSLAFITGGETVVHVTGDGLGGRNQELALAAAEGIAECDNTCVFSIGSDGTDGPTDAAGGYVDEHTAQRLKAKGFRIPDVLKENDAYHALEAVGGLVKTGATGTNVNDLSVVLIKR